MIFYKFKGYWSVKTVRKYPNLLFIYGDNNVQRGNGGQAVIRDEPNTMGIPTKKYPNFSSTSFYTDEDYDDNIYKINNAVNNIVNELKNYDGIVISENGIGTGLALLEIKAPKTNKYLNKRLNELIDIVLSM